MTQIIQCGKEWTRINTQKSTIDSSKDGGHSWHCR